MTKPNPPAKKPQRQPPKPEENKTLRVADGIADTQIRAGSLDVENRTVELIFSTGAPVKRYSWDEGYYMEELDMNPGSVDLSRLNAGASFLNTHSQWEMADRLGAVVPGTARVENGKGYCTVQISRNPEGERIMVDLRDGMALPISVGYRIHQFQKTEGDENTLPVYRATRWEPLEVSAVPVPADFGALARSIEERAAQTPGLIYEVPVVKNGSTAADAARNEETQMTDEEKAAAAEAQRVADQAAADAAELETLRAEKAAREADEARAAQERKDAEAAIRSAAGTPLTQADVDAIVQRRLDEEAARAASITDLGTQFRMTPGFIAKAIKDKTPVAEYRGLILEEMRKAQDKVETFQVAPTFRGDNQDMTARNTAVADAVLARAMPGKFQLNDNAKHFAHRSLLQLAEDILESQGVSARGMSKNEVAKRAFHTTSDFPLIMDQVVNRILRESYRAAPQLWRPLGNQVTAPDFKPMQSIVAGEFGELMKVNEHGEFKRTTFTTGGQQWGIATYGMIFGLTRQAIINDQIGLFTQIPRKFTNSVLRTESTIVWDIFLTNPLMSDGKALFHADHGNLDNTGSALSIASLTAARLRMQKQRDFEGKNDFPVTPKYLVVPPELEFIATQLVYGTFTPTALGETVPDYVRSLTVVVEPKLSPTAGNAKVPWFLVADPATTDTFEYAYLEGENGPFTDQRVGFDIDGTEWKVRLDFGAAPQDWRGFFKNAGVAPSA